MDRLAPDWGIVRDEGGTPTKMVLLGWREVHRPSRGVRRSTGPRPGPEAASQISGQQIDWIADSASSVTTKGE